MPKPSYPKFGKPTVPRGREEPFELHKPKLGKPTIRKPQMFTRKV